MELILELRREFGGKNQKRIIFTPPPSHGIEHPPYELKKFQRIWFDIPILRYPNWFSIQNAKSEEILEVKKVLEFMEQNVQDENYSHTFEGFKPYEILKLKRDIAIMEEQLNSFQYNLNRKNFIHFINQYDKRRNKNFLRTFPTLKKYAE